MIVEMSEVCCAGPDSATVSQSGGLHVVEAVVRGREDTSPLTVVKVVVLFEASPCMVSEIGFKLFVASTVNWT